MVLALNGGGNVDKPYTSCDDRNDLLPVPNGDAESLDERLIWEGCSGSKV